MGYKGQIAQIPLGTMGLFTDAAPGLIPSQALIGATNVDFGPGFIQKAPGSLRYNSATPLSAGIIALIDYWTDVNTQRLFAATSDGKIFRDTGDRTFGGGTAIVSGLGTLGNQCQFVVGGNETASASRKLFFFSGGQSQIKVLEADGITFAAIASPNSDWATPNFPTFGLLHRSRLWTFMGSRAYASTTGDHEDFAGGTALTEQVGPGEGGDIVGAFVFKGRLFVFKEGDFVYYLNDTSTTSSDWYFTKFGEGFGIASFHAATQVLDDLLVGNTNASITSYQAVQAFGDVKSGDIFQQAQVANYFRNNTTPSGSPYMHALYYPEKKLAMFTARTKYGTANNALICLDVSTPQAPRYHFWTKDLPDCLALRRDVNRIKRPMYGAADGYVYLMDQEDRLVGGSAFTGEFKTPHLDFRHLDSSLAHKNKLYDFLGVNFQPEGNHNLSIDVYIDGKFSETITYAQTIDTNYMGSFILDTSKLGVEEEQTIWKPLHGSGRKISFRCYNAGSNENFKATMLTVGFRIAGENATRL